MLHSGRLALRNPNGRAPCSTQASMQLRNGTPMSSVGSVWRPARWSFVEALTLAMLDLTLSAVGSRQWLGTLCSKTRSLARPSRRQTSSLSGCWPLASPTLAAGSRSCFVPRLVGGYVCGVQPSPSCRQPTVAILPPSFDRGAATFPRCNPTMTLSASQFAVAVWGAVQGVATDHGLASGCSNMRAPGLLAAGHILHAHPKNDFLRS